MVGDKLHIDAIIGREIHLLRTQVTPSKVNDGSCLKFQYEIEEQLRDESGQLRVDANGQPVMGWVLHITFTGSKTLAEDMDGLELDEPVRAKVIKQQCKGNNRCFYRLVDPD